MRKRTAIVLTAVLCGPSALQSQATSYAIDNVNVVDVAAGTILAGQRVVIT